MKKERNVYYKISINVGPICFIENTKVYTIKKGKSAILPGVKYSIATILFGWWGWRINFNKPFQSFHTSLTALRTNFAGGEDISTFISEQNFDNKTNYIWNNLYLKTTEVIEKEKLETIFEIQDEYSKNNPDKIYSKDNLNFIQITCRKLDMNEFKEFEILDILEALEAYEKNKRDDI